MRGMTENGRENLKNYIGIFVSVCVIKLLFFFVRADYGINADRIGDLVAPTALAHLDWSLLIPHVAYYGYGFKWIYFIFFRLTDNPTVIYYGILALYDILFALTAVLIYHMLVSYFGVSRPFPAALLSVFMGIVCPADIKSEPSVYIAGWIACFLIVKAVFSEKKKTGYGIALALFLSYCVTLHERMVAIVLSFCIAMVLYRLAFGKWLVHPVSFYVAQALFYLLFRLLGNGYREFFWHTSEVKNSSVLPSSIRFYFLHSLEGFKIAVTCAWSNLVTLGTQTYGLAWIAAAVFLVSLIRLFSGKLPKDCDAGERSIYIVLWMCGIYVAVIIAGLVMKWGVKIYDNSLYGYKGFVYGRYYVNLAYPAIVVSLLWLEEHRVKGRDIAVFFGSVLLLCLVFMTKIYPVLEMAYTSYVPKETTSSTMLEWLLFADFSKHFTMLQNVMLNLTGVAAVLLLAVLYHRGRKSVCSVLLWCALNLLVVFVNTQRFQLTKPSVVFTSGVYGDIYDYFKGLEENGIDLQKNIIYTDFSPWTLQYELNRYRISYDWQERAQRDEDFIYVSCFDPSVVEERLGAESYYYLQTDGQTFIYFSDKGLAEEMRRHGYTMEYAGKN